MKPESEHTGEAERERILVIRFSSLGDILLTAPALRALRRRFPDAHIDLLVAGEYADAASLIPGPDRILTFDRSSGLGGLLRLRSDLSRRYSLLVDLQNSTRSVFLRAATMPTMWVKAKRYRLRRWLLVRFKWNLYRSIIPVPSRYLNAMAQIGADDDGLGLCLQVPDAAIAAAGEFLSTAGIHGQPHVVFCPGARHFTKRWPADRWAEVGRRLIEEGKKVIIFGAQDEKELVQNISNSVPGSLQLTGQAIPKIAAVMKSAQVVISNDSGLMHLAAGVGTPVIAIFGPTVEEFGFFPFRARSEVIQQKLACRPCSAMGSPTCKEGHFRCMLDTESADVLDAAHRLIATPIS